MGYVGKSMSERAVAAYKSGEMPISKWSKKILIEAVEELNENIDIELLSKINLHNLRMLVLTNSSWHHTGTFYSETNFWELDEKIIANLDNERVQDEINWQKKNMGKRTKEEIAAEKAKKEIRKNEKDLKEFCEENLKITKYKTVTGLKKAIENGKISKQEIEIKKQELIAAKRAELKEIWTRQGYERGLKELNSDKLVFSYIK